MDSIFVNSTLPGGVNPLTISIISILSTFLVDSNINRFTSSVKTSSFIPLFSSFVKIYAIIFINNKVNI